MQATVQKLNLKLPYCAAKTANDILVVFTPPLAKPPQIGDVIEVDLLRLDEEQEIRNLTQSTSYHLIIKFNNVHDLKLPGGHGTSRFPSIERRQGGV